jgi:hypothetical protein
MRFCQPPKNCVKFGYCVVNKFNSYYQIREFFSVFLLKRFLIIVYCKFFLAIWQSCLQLVKKFPIFYFKNENQSKYWISLKIKTINMLAFSFKKEKYENFSNILFKREKINTVSISFPNSENTRKYYYRNSITSFFISKFIF